MLKWSLELSELDIQYERKKALKAQVLANFMAEMTSPRSRMEHVGGQSSSTAPPVQLGATLVLYWKTKREP